MIKFFIKPTNIEECRVICKWFDENHGSISPDYYSRKLELQQGYTNAYDKGNVYFSDCPDEARKLTFTEFEELILGIKKDNSILVQCL